MFLYSNCAEFTFCSWFDLLGVALVFRIYILKIFKSIQNYYRRVTDNANLGKYVESFLGHILNFCSNFVKYHFNTNVSERILHLVFYSDLVHKLSW